MSEKEEKIKQLASEGKSGREIAKGLKCCRSLVSYYLNPEGKTKKHKDQLMKKGFDFDFVTNTHTTKAGDTYRFVYEQGYLLLGEGFVLLVERSEEG